MGLGERRYGDLQEANKLAKVFAETGADNWMVDRSFSGNENLQEEVNLSVRHHRGKLLVPDEAVLALLII